MLLRKIQCLLICTMPIFLMGVSGCPSDAPELNWHPKIYLGDSRTKSIVRQADDGRTEQILCADTRFDTKVAMDNTEIAKAKQAYFDVINQCDQWKSEAAALRAYHAMDFVEEK